MSDVTVVLLSDADSRMARTVVDRLSDTERFYREYDLRAVLSGTAGRTANALAERDVPVTVAADPTDPTEALEAVADETVDYLVACGWTHKLPPDSIGLADRAAINCHPSYLPDYRGLSVHRVQWAHAEAFGGVSIHRLTDEFDEGDVVTRARFSIELWDTPLDVLQKYCDLTPVLVREALLLLERGSTESAQGDGRYYSQVEWPTALKHGIVNHVFRAAGVDRRWTIETDR
jgi:methionyl-tRNA formyltransferase